MFELFIDGWCCCYTPCPFAGACASIFCLGLFGIIFYFIPNTAFIAYGLFLLSGCGVVGVAVMLYQVSFPSFPRFHTSADWRARAYEQCMGLMDNAADKYNERRRLPNAFGWTASANRQRENAEYTNLKLEEKRLAEAKSI